MQNYTKSQTRLAFVQYIFQNEFLNTDSSESIEDFQKHFYDTNLSIIDEPNGIFTSSTECLLKLNNRVDRLNCRDTSSLRYDLNVLICFSLL